MSAEGVRQLMKLVDLSGKRTELKKANCFLRLLNSEEAFLCPDSKENFEGSQKVNRKDEKV